MSRVASADGPHDRIPARLDRRQFLVGAGVVGAALIVGVQVGERRARTSGGGARSWAPSAFLRIGTDDTVTVVIGKSEMGQGVYTGLAMLVAEELEIDPARLKVEFAPVDPAFNHPLMPMQFTGGSMSLSSSYEPLRRAGALARTLLVSAAARRWQVDPAALAAIDGTVTDGVRTARYGELVPLAAALEPPGEVVLKDPKAFRVIGRSTHRLDAPPKVSGEARFGLDVRLPGMLFAMVARPPHFGATVESFDAAAARAVRGVLDVRQIPSGVAVIATDTWAARRGRDALTVRWREGPGAGFSTDALRERYRALAAQPGRVAAAIGDAERALGASRRVLAAEYELPYLAHACMEPLNCVAQVADGRCDVWTGTQMQSEDRKAAAAALGIAPEQVHVHTTFLGGGFGRRANPQSDFVVEAVHLAQALGGRPVQVVWTREDDTRGGWYRPFGLSRLRAALDARGLPVAWHHRIVAQPVLRDTVFGPLAVQGGIDPTTIEGAANMPYAVPNLTVEVHDGEAVVPVQWWRSVGHSHTAFVVNGFLDELAAAARRDPLALRRELLAGKPRHLAVLELAAAQAGWGRPAAPGRFRGVALAESFGSIVAQVAEASVEGAEVRVHRVVCAIDCGLAVNPDQVAAQMQSGVIFGLTAALRGQITLRDGRVEQSNFHDYPLLRLAEAPHVETHIVPSTAPMGGAGEPGVPCIAPAVCGAIFAATGRRIRALPVARALAGT